MAPFRKNRDRDSHRGRFEMIAVAIHLQSVAFKALNVYCSLWMERGYF
jgi:hypothetical protein